MSMDDMPVWDRKNDTKTVFQKTITIEEFVQKYIPSKVAQIKLDRYLEALVQVSTLNDEIIQDFNSVWQNREKGVVAIGGPRYLN